jgi:hypothetical protein
MFPPVKGHSHGLNSPVAKSLHSTIDPFKNIDQNNKRSKAQMMQKLTKTAEGKESILKEIHSMRLKIFEDQILDTNENKNIKPYLPLLSGDEKNKILERFIETKK